MVVGGGAHIKGVTERRCSGFLSDVAIDKHQQSHFFNGSLQHELDVSGAYIPRCCRFDSFLTSGIMSQVWGDMQKKRRG